MLVQSFIDELCKERMRIVTYHVSLAPERAKALKWYLDKECLQVHLDVSSHAHFIEHIGVAFNTENDGYCGAVDNRNLRTLANLQSRK